MSGSGGIGGRDRGCVVFASHEQGPIRTWCWWPCCLSSAAWRRRWWRLIRRLAVWGGERSGRGGISRRPGQSSVGHFLFSGCRPHRASSTLLLKQLLRRKEGRDVKEQRQSATEGGRSAHDSRGVVYHVCGYDGLINVPWSHCVCGSSAQFARSNSGLERKRPRLWRGGRRHPTGAGGAAGGAISHRSSSFTFAPLFGRALLSAPFWSEKPSDMPAKQPKERA